MLVVKVSGEQTIESALLYQHLIVVSQSGDISSDEVMQLWAMPIPAILGWGKIYHV